jgi:L-amino acid N-acyltransferase YncA
MIRIGPMDERHAEAVLRIMQSGIESGDATFETAAPTWADFATGHLDQHRFVALGWDDQVMGWTAAVPISSRCVYGGVIESSVYVDPRNHGCGVGKRLLAALVESAECAGIWTIQAEIFPENTASLALHQGCGFRIVGFREGLGQLRGRWRDVQLLERRSRIVGV